MASSQYHLAVAGGCEAIIQLAVNFRLGKLAPAGPTELPRPGADLIPKPECSSKNFSVAHINAPVQYCIREDRE